MPTARELIEQADALMRRNRSLPPRSDDVAHASPMPRPVSTVPEAAGAPPMPGERPTPAGPAEWAVLPPIEPRLQEALNARHDALLAAIESTTHGALTPPAQRTTGSDSYPPVDLLGDGDVDLPLLGADDVPVLTDAVPLERAHAFDAPFDDFPLLTEEIEEIDAEPPPEVDADGSSADTTADRDEASMLERLPGAAVAIPPPSADDAHASAVPDASDGTSGIPVVHLREPDGVPPTAAASDETQVSIDADLDADLGLPHEARRERAVESASAEQAESAAADAAGILDIDFAAAGPSATPNVAEPSDTRPVGAASIVGVASLTHADEIDRALGLDRPPGGVAPTPAPAAGSPPTAVDDARWVALAEDVRMQVLQRIDIFTDTGLRDQLGARLKPIVDRASADLVATINQHVGDLLRAYVAEAIEREIDKWKRDSVGG